MQNEYFQFYLVTRLASYQEKGVKNRLNVLDNLKRYILKNSIFKEIFYGNMIIIIYFAFMNLNLLWVLFFNQIKFVNSKTFQKIQNVLNRTLKLEKWLDWPNNKSKVYILFYKYQLFYYTSCFDYFKIYKKFSNYLTSEFHLIRIFPKIFEINTRFKQKWLWNNISWRVARDIQTLESLSRSRWRREARLSNECKCWWWDMFLRVFSSDWPWDLQATFNGRDKKSFQLFRHRRLWHDWMQWTPRGFQENGQAIQ